MIDDCSVRPTGVGRATFWEGPAVNGWPVFTFAKETPDDDPDLFSWHWGDTGCVVSRDWTAPYANPKRGGP